MTRPFALFTMSLGLSFLGGLVFLHVHLVDTAADPALEKSWELNLRLIEDQVEELDYLRWETEDLLADDSKYKFRPILTVFEEAEKQVGKLTGFYHNKTNADSDPRATLRTIGATANSALYHTAAAARKLVCEHRIALGLREEDVTELIKYIDETTTREVLRPVLFYPRRARLRIEVEQQLLVLSTLAKVKDLLLSMMTLGSTCALTVESYFPVIVDDTSDLERGEHRVVRIAVGSYLSPLDPETFSIEVGGESLSVNEDGVAEYELPTGRSGRQQISAEVRVLNRLTGETRVGEMTYHYRVR